MLRALLLLLITGSSMAAVPEAYHLIYEQVGKTTTRLEVTYNKGKATLMQVRGADKIVIDPFSGAEALWAEIAKAKLFEYKPETGPAAPDFGEVHLSAEATENGKKSATALVWHSPLRNDGQVWSLLNHLDILMSGPPQAPVAAPSPVEPPGGVPTGPPGPPPSPVPTDPPVFTPAPPSPAALPPATRPLGAPLRSIREMAAPRDADRIAALIAAQATRHEPRGTPIQVEPVQPAAIETLLASVATRLPLPLTAWEPAANPLTADALARARRLSYEAALRQLDARLAARPRSADLYSLRGATRSELADLPGALADFSRAASLQPHRADHRHNRGVVHARLKHFEKARSDFEAAHRLAPGRFEPAPLVLAGANARTWRGRPGRHLMLPREDLR